MSRWAIGDVQGCYEELRELLEKAGFSADRDRLWFVGDLVNRGPRSLEVLRFVHALGENAVTVLGNHDLHLLAVAAGSRRERRSDTIAQVLESKERERLLEWLTGCPLAYRESDDLMVHAGVVPQWSGRAVLTLAGEVQSALRREPKRLFEHMYGDEPRQWSESLAGMERLRFIINVLTRMRLCTREGRVNLTLKGKPPDDIGTWLPWFDVDRPLTRGLRIVCGHWSAIGLQLRDDLAALDTGCVWGGALTGLNLDTGVTVAVPSRGYQSIEA